MCSVERQRAIVKMFLEKGAHVNAEGHGILGTSLQAVCSCPDGAAVVRLMLEKGALVNAVGLTLYH